MVLKTVEHSPANLPPDFVISSPYLFPETKLFVASQVHKTKK